MQAAIQMAVGVLLLFAAVALLIVIVHSVFPRHRDITVGNTPTTSTFREPRGRRYPRQLKEHRTKFSRDPDDGGEGDPNGRIALLAAGVGAVLTTLLVRLWSMQVISSETYTAAAESNSTTTYSTRAPRGRILDRNGNVLVDNRATLAVMAGSDVSSDPNTMRRLSVVLGMPYAAVRKCCQSTSGGAQADRLVALDVSERIVGFISEHPGAFPNVSIEARSVRTYPYGSLAAHLLGYTGTISETELAAVTDDSPIEYSSGDIVGKTGVEYAFESVLQGAAGTKTVEVDAEGSVVSLIDEVDPQIGNDVRLSIDLKVQQAAEKALTDSLTISHETDYPDAAAGALVCLDVTTGAVVAMASYPTYDPSDFIGGISTELWDSLTADDSGYPLTNRAIAGLYPAGSTFKSFTGQAGLKYGFCSSTSTVDCTGTWTGFGTAWPQKCWLTTGHGVIGFVKGVIVSCDVVFYEIAKQFYDATSTIGDTALQDYLRTWGFGSTTGLDISGEASGRVPDPAWKAVFDADSPEYATWQAGDYSNLIIGQGDLLVTPLQLAAAYMGIANGSTIYQPHVLKEVLSEDGSTLIEQQPVVGCTPDIDAGELGLVKEGLEGVVSEGEVKSLFSDFGVVTAGKTGTAESSSKDPYGWYVGYGPVSSPQYVCIAIIEQGGYGATCAAPAVRATLAAAFGITDDFGTAYVASDSR